MPSYPSDYTPDYAVKLAAQHKGTAESQLSESGPRQIAVLTKRAEELFSYGSSVSQRAHGALNRILGTMPEAGSICGESPDEDEAEWARLERAFTKIERVIAELDGAARRLEGF